VGLPPDVVDRFTLAEGHVPPALSLYLDVDASLAIQGMDLSNSMQPYMSLFFIGLGFLFLMIGLIADMMTKIYYGLKIETPYTIHQVLDFEEAPVDQAAKSGGQI